MLGKLYIIGGEDLIGPDCNKVDVVSLYTGEDAAAAPMRRPRVDLAVASSASSIFVFGGTHEGNELSSCELVDTQSGW